MGMGMNDVSHDWSPKQARRIAELEVKLHAEEVVNGGLTTKIHYLEAHAGLLAKKLSEVQTQLSNSIVRELDLEDRLNEALGD